MKYFVLLRHFESFHFPMMKNKFSLKKNYSKILHIGKICLTVFGKIKCRGGTEVYINLCGRISILLYYADY